MEEGNTKNGWEHTSRDLASFMKRQLPTVPTRTASQNEQIGRSWKESNRLSQNSNSTKGYGWKSRIQWSISRITVQQRQSQLRPMNSGTAPSLISLISELSDRPHMCTFQRKSGSNSTSTLTRGL